jgi:hypothetical protein
MSPIRGKDTTLKILAATYVYPGESNGLRLLAHYGNGGDEASELLIKWIGTGAYKIPASLDRKEGAQVLGVYLDNWEFTAERQKMREDFVLRISETVESGKWTGEDLPLLKKAEEALKSGKFEDQANAVNRKIGKV